MKKIYFAGPDVFKPNAKEIGTDLKNLVKEYGFEGHYPLDNEVIESNKHILGCMIYNINVNMIKSCDIVLANLEPFRGPSADCGTVWECAFAKGLGKKVFGYNTSLTSYKSKVLNKLPHDGMLIEDFNTWDNIMLVHSLDANFHNIYDAITNLNMNL